MNENNDNKSRRKEGRTILISNDENIEANLMALKIFI